jgi:hypothetical protein
MLRFRHYEQANTIAKHSEKDRPFECKHFTSWCSSYREAFLPLRAKLSLCCAFINLAQEERTSGEEYIKDAINGLRAFSDHYTKRSFEDVHNEICNAIDNELIQEGFRSRCDRSGEKGVKIVGPNVKGDKDWEPYTGCLSFWDG